MYLIKIGSQYLTADGGFSPRQLDALRVYDDVRLVRDLNDNAGPRLVHLKTRQTSQTVDNAPDIDPRD